ncbi:retrovirus-related Pol polyprotein from transposon gypsy [Elysia marginata]|uniref:Retrovirus-related Pol polyprotein from transposon gypsy n=1 Tax=Elysia marginata TaxID=1093978 RepID=A0AAV4HNY9_9GAST|nr:retrovirus-related Pol polyprotein from transposon gypsy [Elysia marginata]
MLYLSNLHSLDRTEGSYHTWLPGVQRWCGARSSEDKEWPSPTNAKEMRAFLGFARYYRRFVQNFAAIARLLTDIRKEPRNSEIQ